MAGVLNAGGPPPAPIPQPNQPSVSQGVLSAPGAGLPPGIQQLRQPYFPGAPQPTFAAPPAAPGAAPPPGPGVPPAPPPAPTYGQALSALRHFSAIRREVQRILRDPSVGKTSVKPKIVDAVADLVADRILTASAAVEQLALVPERPFEQKQWLMQQISQADQAEAGVLAHYRQGIANTPPEAIDRTSDPENHLSDVAALMQQYRRGQPK